jgi:hypothetical protein
MQTKSDRKGKGDIVMIKEKQYYDALLYIQGIARDRDNTNDPEKLKIFLKAIEYVCEDALIGDGSLVKGVNFARASYSTFGEDKGEQ